MKKILILYNHRSKKLVTGGHFYEENMYNCLLEYNDFIISRVCINRPRKFINKLFSPLLNLKYFSECKKYNLVIFNSVEGWYFIPLLFLLRVFTKTKIAIIHHHFIYLEFSGIKRIFYKILEDQFLRLSNFIITVSPYIKDLCQNKYKNKNIRIWPIPFSNETIHTPDIEKSNNLIYIGTIEPRKGLIYLIQALIILKKQNLSLNLDIIGKVKDDSYYNEILHLINLHNLQVRFLGFIDNDQKNILLSKSKIFVFPSLLEGYGMVLREVMAYGLPIVCFDNSAMPYLVKNNINGILVENKNSKKFAEAIASIATDDNLRKRLSDGAYASTKETMTPEKYKEHLHSDLCSII